MASHDKLTIIEAYILQMRPATGKGDQGGQDGGEDEEQGTKRPHPALQLPLLAEGPVGEGCEAVKHHVKHHPPSPKVGDEPAELAGPLHVDSQERVTHLLAWSFPPCSHFPTTRLAACF